jgi:hypothetical protein
MSANKDLFEAQTLNHTQLDEIIEIRKWLTGKNKSTKNFYLSAVRAFIEFTKLSPKELIDLADGDRRKSSRERGDPELKVTSFFEYLINDYILKTLLLS